MQIGKYILWEIAHAFHGPSVGRHQGQGGGHVPGIVWWRGRVHKLLWTQSFLCVFVFAGCYGWQNGFLLMDESLRLLGILEAECWD